MDARSSGHAPPHPQYGGLRAGGHGPPPRPPPRVNPPARPSPLSPYRLIPLGAS
ncbi:MAG: hypothetical protein QXM16_08185 [Nitrososphaerota archaeon]